MSNTDQTLDGFCGAVVRNLPRNGGTSRSSIRWSDDSKLLEWTLQTPLGETVARISVGNYRESDRETIVRAMQIAERDAMDVLYEKNRKEVSYAQLC